MFLYSALANMFYQSDLKDLYVASGTLPIDVIEVDDELYIKFSANSPPEGKRRVAGKNGLPEFADIPTPSKEQLIIQADAEKSQLLTIAKESIEPLSDAVDFDEATDDEIEMLRRWKKFRLALTRIDTSTAPDITWPEAPV